MGLKVAARLMKEKKTSLTSTPTLPLDNFRSAATETGAREASEWQQIKKQQPDWYMLVVVHAYQENT